MKNRLEGKFENERIFSCLYLLDKKCYEVSHRKYNVAFSTLKNVSNKISAIAYYQYNKNSKEIYVYLYIKN